MWRNQNPSHRELKIADELAGKSFQHVMEVLDSGEDAEAGGYYLVMPRAEGSLSDELINRGMLQPDPSVDILRQIAEGLWGARKFFWCVQILRGVTPPPPKATRNGAVGGLVLHLIIITIGAAAGYFLLALLTTQPYVLTDNGLTVGARPPHYQERFVPWNQITLVRCHYGRYDVPGIADIYLYTTKGKERLTNGVVRLEPVRDSCASTCPMKS